MNPHPCLSCPFPLSVPEGRTWTVEDKALAGRHRRCPSYQDEFPITQLPCERSLLPVPLLHMDKFAPIQRHCRLWEEVEPKL